MEPVDNPLAQPAVQPQEPAEAGQPEQGDYAPQQPPSQASAPQTPVQVETVTYNVKVGAVESKVGLAFTLLSGSLFFLGLIVWIFLRNLINLLFEGAGSADVGGMLVFTVAATIALAPAVYMANKRLNANLQENPAAIEDIRFKKKLRRSFLFYTILSILGLFATVYSLLSAAFLKSNGLGIQAFLNFLVFFAIVGSLAWFYWKYQKRTTR